MMTSRWPAGSILDASFFTRSSLVRDFSTLKVWRKAHDLALNVHTALARKSDSGTGLRAQMIRSALSAPTNIAEGCGKPGALELARYSDIAAGSVKELQYQLVLARDLGLLDKATSEELSLRADEVRRMLFVFAREVRRRAANSSST
jgi:four helix bundle protein